MGDLVQQESNSAQRTWLDYITDVAPEFNAMSESHKAVRWAEECQFAHEVVMKNPMLSKSIVATVQNAIKNVAAVGLTLNPAHGYAYLVPEYNKQMNGTECQLRISFKGLIKLATDSGSIAWVKAEVVHQNDTFNFNGHGNAPTHSFNPFVDRGPMVGVYCQAKTHDGDFLVDMMTIDELMKIKASAKIQTVWDKWFEEMAKKAVIKRASKQWPKTEQFDRVSTAVDILNNNEGNKEESYTDEHKEKFFNYLDNGTAIEFVGYINHINNENEDIYHDLYNSGEKGKKVALKDKIKAKTKEGWILIESAIHDLSSDDDEVKEETARSLTELEIQTIKNIVKERGKK